MEQGVPVGGVADPIGIPNGLYRVRLRGRGKGAGLLQPPPGILLAALQVQLFIPYRGHTLPVSGQVVFTQLQKLV